MLSRRTFIQATATLGAGLLMPRWGWGDAPEFGPFELPRGALDDAMLHALPGKRPLIKRTFRAPNYETPVALFDELFTPNDAFFVRYHLARIPEVDADGWRLRIGGEGVQTPLELSLEQLRQDFEQVELAAVCQCSGNRRGLFQPHVPGVQWGYGAMGNARWKGVRLRDVLNKAGVRKEAMEVVLEGADSGVLERTPDFTKSLPVWKALDEHTLIAYEMNGESLPHWNGYPARLVVPGWTATYWMKHLTSVEIVNRPFDGFWVKTAYRIPRHAFPITERFVSQETEANTPITEMVVNSLITQPEEGRHVPLGRAVEFRGIAWDGGYGVRRVEVSIDGGQEWREAELGRDHGRYSWREWRFRHTPDRRGDLAFMVKASNRIGATQTFEPIANPAGYHHNVVQKRRLVVS